MVTSWVSCVLLNLGLSGAGSLTKKKTVDAGDNLECLPMWHMGKESACQ